MTCETDEESNTLIISNLLLDPYVYEEDQTIEFSILDIKMPSSTRMTGEYKIEFLDNIEGEYKLVDTTAVYDKIRGLPGELDTISITPQVNQTDTEDTFDFEVKLSHAILQGGYLEIYFPEELYFTRNADCPLFGDSFDQKSVGCRFDIDRNMVTVTGGFPDGDYQELDKPLKFSVHGIFTQRSMKATSNFKFVTYDKDGWQIDKHGTFFLGPMLAAKTIT